MADPTQLGGVHVGWLCIYNGIIDIFRSAVSFPVLGIEKGQLLKRDKHKFKIGAEITWKLSCC